MTTTAVMLCGHGSRDPEAIREFDSLAERMRAELSEYDVVHGYLEFAQPVIRNGLDELRGRGANRILAVPGMLLAAGHVKNDIPSVLNTYMAEYPELEIRYARDLAVDAKLMRAAGERVAEAEAVANETVDLSRHETLLLVVGRGTSDPDANSNVSKVTRMLWEGMGFGWAETAYSGVTFPLVGPALEHGAKLGYRRIIVFPYFLFTGVLVRRIYEAADRVAAHHPEIQVVNAPYLNDHPLVRSALTDRVAEILDGTNNMNCQLCKYRDQVLGFEGEVGLPQQSHHFHVEGIGTGDPSTHDHDPDHHHGAGHDHDPGHHYPYPHADHPLGPRSMRRGGPDSGRS